MNLIVLPLRTILQGENYELLALCLNYTNVLG